jgi:small subunit ribosomal protein S6
MNKKHYESTVIINAAIEEDQIEATLNRILETIKVNGGEVIDVDKWGRKRLVYAIQKTKSGYYVVIRFAAPPDLITKLERMYQLDEFILRYIVVALDKFALEYIEKNRIEKTQEPLPEVIQVNSETTAEVKEVKQDNVVNNS